jgi:hypothetical protein
MNARDGTRAPYWELQLVMWEYEEVRFIYITENLTLNVKIYPP